jgi:protein-disulfide isomerase
MDRSPPTRRKVLGGLSIALLPTVAGCQTLTASESDEPEARVESLPTPVAGDTDSQAAVTVAAYLDYSSALCRTYMREVYPRIASRFVKNERVRYEHHDFPMPINRWSWDAAIAARAVQDHLDVVDPASASGMQHFWEFTKLAFQKQSQYSVDQLASLADEVDPDDAAGNVVREAIEAEQYLPVVEADRRHGVEHGVEQVPTILVNGSAVEPTEDAIASAIESELPSN